MNRILIVGDERLPDLTKLGDLIMKDEKSELKRQDNETPKMEMKIKGPPTIKTMLDDWAEALKAKGKTAFWPTWAYGTYISDKNRKAKANAQRLATRKYPDEGKRIATKHGKLVLVPYNRKEEAEQNYFKEANALSAIASVLINMGTRQHRRALCKKLKLKWSYYKEAEAMIMESKNFTGVKYDAIKLSRGINV